jgi:DNA repair exonuclease SbcCD ATPase subunit
MRRIIYKNLKGQNFLSVGNDQISVDFQSGFNLITGRNIDNPDRVNGIGKSVMAELFYFALFGKTIREIKKDFIINNITKGKGAIELTFDVETEQDVQTYTIKRQVKPSTVTLLRCEEDIQGFHCQHRQIHL